MALPRRPPRPKAAPTTGVLILRGCRPWYGCRCECLARLGVDKFRAVKDVAPALAVKGFIQNLLNEKSADGVVIEATYIHAEPYNAAEMAQPLSGESADDLAKWLECWSRVEVMDMHLWPLWDKEVHDILQPLFKELQLIFLAYTRSISEDSAEDAMEMSMDEFHDFVVDVGLETKDYKFDVMCNQFIKANAVNSETSPAVMPVAMLTLCRSLSLLHPPTRDGTACVFLTALSCTDRLTCSCVSTLVLALCSRPGACAAAGGEARRVRARSRREGLGETCEGGCVGHREGQDVGGGRGQEGPGAQLARVPEHARQRAANSRASSSRQSCLHPACLHPSGWLALLAECRLNSR